MSVKAALAHQRSSDTRRRENTRQRANWVVSSGTSGGINLAPGEVVCGLLTQHHIAELGICRNTPPIEFKPGCQGAMMLACNAGRTQVHCDGETYLLEPGLACLLPPFAEISILGAESGRSEFCWIRFNEPSQSSLIPAPSKAIVAHYDARLLETAIVGLHHQSQDAGAMAALPHWVDLVAHYVFSFSRPHQPDERLCRLWDSVKNDLSSQWSLRNLARVACVSEEQLRRLCHKELGRSPVQHLSHLRIQKARQLLATTDRKVATVAAEVGFKSPFTFSNTYKRVIGFRPSEQRV